MKNSLALSCPYTFYSRDKSAKKRVQNKSSDLGSLIMEEFTTEHNSPDSGSLNQIQFCARRENSSLLSSWTSQKNGEKKIKFLLHFVQPFLPDILEKHSESTSRSNRSNHSRRRWGWPHARHSPTGLARDWFFLSFEIPSSCWTHIRPFCYLFNVH